MVHALLKARLLARMSRDFPAADKIRTELRIKLSIEVDDKEKTWKAFAAEGHTGFARAGGGKREEGRSPQREERDEGRSPRDGRADRNRGERRDRDSLRDRDRDRDERPIRDRERCGGGDYYVRPLQQPSYLLYYV